MNAKKLAKIQIELENLRNSPQGHRAATFESLAVKLGREKVKRGKEPTWEMVGDACHLFPPLTIPHHGNRDMKTGTARCVIEALLNDVYTWSDYLELH